MRKFVLYLFVVLAAVCLCSCKDYVEGGAGKMHILSIGLTYQGTGASTLGGPVNDALETGTAMDKIMNSKSIPRSLSFMIQETGTEDREDINYPTAEHIVNKIGSLKPSSNDLVFVFYSGHGQNVYWAECPVCSHETYVFYEEELKDDYYCSECLAKHDLLLGLSNVLKNKGQSSSAAAAQWLAGTISGSEYITALKADSCDLTREILELVRYISDWTEDESYLNPLFSIRAFMVGAPEKIVGFKQWMYESFGSKQTLAGDLATRIYQDAFFPEAESYPSDMSGYYTAMRTRLSSYYTMYDADWLVFEKCWRTYSSSVWADGTNWTELYLDSIVAQLNALPCRSVFVVDCCYSGHAEQGHNFQDISFGKAFTSMFKKIDADKITVLSASTPDQVSIDTYKETEDGQSERHGLFTIALLDVLGWHHSASKMTYVTVNGEIRAVHGYLGTTPERMTASEVMEKIKDSWTYMNQTPLVNTTYLGTVFIP